MFTYSERVYKRLNLINGISSLKFSSVKISTNIVSLTFYLGGIAGDWLHVATANPLVIYSMQSNQNFVICTDLYPLFPYNYFNQPPQIKIAALSGDIFQGQLIFHEQQSNMMLLLDPNNNELQQVVINTDSLARTISKQFKQTKYKMCYEKTLGNSLVVYADNGKEIQLVDFDASREYTISLPFIVDQLHVVSEKMWIVGEKDTNARYILSTEQGALIPNLLTTIKDTLGEEQFVLDKISASALPQDVLEGCQTHLPDVFLPDFSSSTVRLVASGDNLASLAISNPAKIQERYPLSFYSYPRKQKDKQGTCSSFTLEPMKYIH